MSDKDDDIDIDFGDKKESAPADKSGIKPLDLSQEDMPKEKPPSVLIVVRHGNTFEKDETPRRIGARTDLPLTREGAMQIIKLRAHFEENGLLPTRLYASPLQRTAQTAKVINNSFEVLEFLREIYHGMDENKTDEEVIRRIGKQALIDWEVENKLPPGWTADILMIRQGWTGLKKLCRDVGGVWMAVTSGGIARFSLEDVEGAPKNRKLATGSYGKLVYDRNRDTWVCEGWSIKP